MRTLNKVVHITLLFWLMKIVATTLGGTLGDFIALTNSKKEGLNLGTLPASIVSILLMSTLIFISHRNLKIKHPRLNEL